MQKQEIIKELKEIIARAEKLCAEKNDDEKYDSAFKYGAVCAAIENLIKSAEK